MNADLSYIVKFQINLLGLEDQDELQVMESIRMYAKPRNLSEKIYWIIYRIWNAIKHIFGKSDFQISQQIVTDRLKDLKESLYFPVNDEKESANSLILSWIECTETQDKISSKAAEILAKFHPKNIAEEVKTTVRNKLIEWAWDFIT